MNIHWCAILLTGLMMTGCDALPKKTYDGAISCIQISSDPANIKARQIIITNQHALKQITHFLENHSSGWETSQTTPPSPEDFVIAYKTNGEIVNLGYASNMLFKYKWGHDKQKQIDSVQIETFKKLLNTIRNVSGSF